LATTINYLFEPSGKVFPSLCYGRSGYFLAWNFGQCGDLARSDAEHQPAVAEFKNHHAFARADRDTGDDAQQAGGCATRCADALDQPQGAQQKHQHDDQAKGHLQCAGAQIGCASCRPRKRGGSGCCRPASADFCGPGNGSKQ
jgi:hypothetical protein